MAESNVELIRQGFEDLAARGYEAMDELHFEPHEFREIGDWVVVPFTLTARGRSTGLEAEQYAVMAWQLRDEKAVRLEVFAELEEALATVEEPAG